MRTKDDREDALRMLLTATKAGEIKWKLRPDRKEGEMGWKAVNKNGDTAYFSPNLNGCISACISPANGNSHMFNVWPGDIKMVALGRELSAIVLKKKLKPVRTLTLKETTQTFVDGL
jgi:hypothetical protein